MSEAHRVSDLIRSELMTVGDGHRAKLEEIGHGGPAFLRAGAMSETGFDWTGLEHFSSTGFSIPSAKFGHASDVVITTKGNSIGRTQFVPEGSPEFVYSPHLSYWRSLDQSAIDSRYLYFWTRSAEFVAQLRVYGFNTDMAPYLSLRDQLAMTITLPAIQQQRAIAEVLGALDDKIAANERLLAVIERWVQVVVTVECLPEVPLERLAQPRRVSVNPALLEADLVDHFSLPAYDSGKLPVKEDPNGILSSKFTIDQPSVLVSKLNPRFPRVWDVPALSSEASSIASTEFVVLEPNTVSSTVLWSSLIHPRFGLSLESKVAGTSGSHQRILPGDMLATAVADVSQLPVGLAESISTLGLKSHAVRAETVRLTGVRDTLLPELMSGRLRVKDVEKQVEDVV